MSHDHSEMLPSVTRRGLLTAAAGLAMAPALSAEADKSHAKKASKNFLWGVATAGHQVEGSNVNSDYWAMEHAVPTIFAESSGDACDQYNRWYDDIKLVAKLGFNCYRFSIEWSRIEPAQGEFLRAELEHYRRLMASCRELGLSPVLTFNHFTVPRWFAAQGGWENPQAPELFTRYCERATEHLGDLISVAATMNEPNGVKLLRWFDLPKSMVEGQEAMLRAAAKVCGSERFSSLMMGKVDLVWPNLLQAHAQAYTAIKAGRGDFPVGVTLALIDDQAAEEGSVLERKRAECYQPWFDVTRSHGDFVGVQTYGRSLLGKQGTLPPPKDAVLTQMGDEIYPQALEHTIRYAAQATGKPVYVTENGIATDDDLQRVAYIDGALAGVDRCIADGVDVRGYIHWSLLDNFEWLFGYKPKFGLVAVDRNTQQRTPKPSAYHLGAIAKRRRRSAA